MKKGYPYCFSSTSQKIYGLSRMHQTSQTNKRARLLLKMVPQGVMLSFCKIRNIRVLLTHKGRFEEAMKLFQGRKECWAVVKRNLTGLY